MKYTIECELFGALKRDSKKNNFSIQIPAGATYLELLTKRLKFKKEHLKFFTVIAGGRTVENFSDAIRDKSKIKILMTIGGG